MKNVESSMLLEDAGPTMNIAPPFDKAFISLIFAATLAAIILTARGGAAAMTTTRRGIGVVHLCIH